MAQSLGFLEGGGHVGALMRAHDWSSSPLGSPEVWPQSLRTVVALLLTYREDLPLVMNRKGYDEETWFSFSYSPVRDESGKVAGMFCAVSETTRRVLAERALRQSEARLLALNETLEGRVTEGLAETLSVEVRP